MIKTITAIGVGAALFVGSITSAHALGEREKNVLATLGGIYVIEKIVDHSNRDKDRYEGPITSREERAYRQGRLERERQEAARRERRAYECGYSGNC